jgi:hypothetical protein
MWAVLLISTVQNSAQQQGLDYDEMMKKAAEMQAQDPQEAIPRVVSAEDVPLPAGWASAQDAQGRTYYCKSICQLRVDLLICST